MTKLDIAYNKIVTVISTELKIVNGVVKDGNGSVFSFKTKKLFFDFAAKQEAMNVMVSQNAKGFEKKMLSLGFKVESSKEGCFDWETKFYCSK